MTDLMSYPEAVAWLDAHVGRGVHPGLERIAGLLDLMGNPEDGYPIIHVAGSNGKTSVARIATMILAGHGLTTGTFTSPHLERVEERIGLNGTSATPEQFAQAAYDVSVFADIFEQRTGTGLTYFELTTAMAFAFFADQAVNAAVVEVGLGGRLDATNAAHGDVSVLTSIGLEHTEYLGDTVELIAREKLAIVEEGSVIVVGALPPDAERVAHEVSAAKSARLFRYGHDFRIDAAARAVGGWSVDIEGIHGRYEDLFLPLHGRHQTVNLAVAVAAVEALLERELDAGGLADAVSVVTSPGRMEPVEAGWLLDGAHNPDGFAALGAALAEEFASVRWVVVLGAMEDKDLAAMLPALAGRVDAVVATRPDSPRALAADRLAAAAGELLGVRTEAVDDVAAALARAREIAGPDNPVLVTGSLYLVGPARSLLLGHPAAQRNER